MTATLTLNDVLDYGGEVKFSMDMFGYSAKEAKEYNERIQALGKAICKDQGIAYPSDKETICKLPHDTPLGPGPRRSFVAFRKWAESSVLGRNKRKK